MSEHLLDLAKRMFAALEVDGVLTSALDGLIQLCGAERGMVLLFGEDGSILFEKARHLAKSDIGHPEFEVSRTIIRHVQGTGQPIFEPAIATGGSATESMTRLGVLGVICYPLVREGKVFGVVYLDNRNPRQRFENQSRTLAEECTEMLAVAAYGALERRRLRGHEGTLERELRDRFDFSRIVGSDPTLIEVLRRCAQVAPADATVLIEGESGTGKDLLAAALHANSQRARGPFLAINCGAVPESLQEAQLFGSERGAFTGADRTVPGYFEEADGGTLFLDEVGEMPYGLQVKLLRVLDSGEFLRVGSTKVQRADVRILAATNRDLEGMVREGKVRRDLYYRLAVFRLRMPPLRERRGDLPLLVDHFLAQQRVRPDGRRLRLSAASEALLRSYDFPGNVRQLRYALEAAALMAEGALIEPHHLPDEIRRRALPGELAATIDPTTVSFGEGKRQVVEHFERAYLSSCLGRSGGHITNAARLAGMDVKNFHTKMKALGIDPNEFKAKRT